MPKTAAAQDVLDFWFDESKPDQWYKKDPAFDETIRSRFEDTITAALSARLDSWADELDSCLALILVLDQFTRNIYRDTPKAFCLLYTSPSPRDISGSRMPSSA